MRYSRQRIFSKLGENKKEEKCITEGVINTVPVGTAALQATQAVKLLIEEKIEDDLLRVDVWNKIIKIEEDKNCSLAGFH